MSDRLISTLLPFVPSGPPPTANEFAAYCRSAQSELLWARHDKRGRTTASRAVAHAWNLMRYMGAGQERPRPPLDPQQLLKIRPEQAAGEAIRALALAIDWAERRPDFKRSA